MLANTEQTHRHRQFRCRDAPCDRRILAGERAHHLEAHQDVFLLQGSLLLPITTAVVARWQAAPNPATSVCSPLEILHARIADMGARCAQPPVSFGCG